MSPAARFPAQLASIMEALANAAVAEICALVDGGYSALQLEISRSRRENEALRRKLRAARAPGPGHRPTGAGPRRRGAAGGEVMRATPSHQDTPRSSACGQEAPPGTEATTLMDAVIKVEDDEESWSRPEQDEVFCRVVDEQVPETQAPPPLTKREVADEGVGSSRAWTSGDVSSTNSGFDCILYGPQVQGGAPVTQNPPSEDPGYAHALNAGASDSARAGGLTFTVTEVVSLAAAAAHRQPAGLHGNQQGAPPAPNPRPPAERLHARERRDRWSPQDGGEKTFSCNFCGKTLACLKNLKTHMRVHTGEKPFVCALCGKRFADSSNLKRHQSVHTGEKRYGCVHCGKRFAQSGSLKVHMTVHTDCKQFRCTYCGKTFISGSHLRRHVTMHGGERRYAPAFQ